MTTVVDIFNMALGHVRSGKRVEATTERSEEARQCNRFYNQTRKEVLEAFDWNFARRRRDLSVSAEDPPAGWDFAYGYPTCLIVRSLVNPLGDDVLPVPFEIGLNEGGNAKLLFTSLENAVARCTLDVNDPNLFSTLFVSAISRLLAVYISGPLTSDKTIQQTQYEAYKGVLRQATASNANERGQKEPPDASWVSGRA